MASLKALLVVGLSILGGVLIKAFQPQDVFSLAKLQQQGQLLDLEDQIVHPRSPLRAALLSWVWPSTPTTSTYILVDSSDETDPHFGLVQTRERRGLPEQDIIFLSPSLASGNGSHAIWQRLLAHVCVRAGEAGHHRIYARVLQDGTEAQIFKNVGFVDYAEEVIYRLTPDKFPASVRDELGLRRQTEADSWQLQRLYAAATPRAVQFAEGLAQGQWQLKSQFMGYGRRLGYVWERDGEILAALHLRIGKLGYSLRFLIHPDIISEAETLIESGLYLVKQVVGQISKPIYSTIRTYQSEIGSILLDVNFECIAAQTIMVKYTTVRAKDLLPRLIGLDVPVEAKAATPSPFINGDNLQVSSGQVNTLSAKPSPGGVRTKEPAQNGA